MLLCLPPEYARIAVSKAQGDWLFSCILETSENRNETFRFVRRYVGGRLSLYKRTLSRLDMGYSEGTSLVDVLTQIGRGRYALSV